MATPIAAMLYVRGAEGEQPRPALFWNAPRIGERIHCAQFDATLEVENVTHYCVTFEPGTTVLETPVGPPTEIRVDAKRI